MKLRHLFSTVGTWISLDFHFKSNFDENICNLRTKSTSKNAAVPLENVVTVAENVEIEKQLVNRRILKYLHNVYV